MNNQTLPKVIKTLEETFITRVNRMDSEREVMLKVGQQEVIDYLKQLNEENADVCI